MNQREGVVVEDQFLGPLLDPGPDLWRHLQDETYVSKAISISQTKELCATLYGLCFSSSGGSVSLCGDVMILEIFSQFVSFYILMFCMKKFLVKLLILRNVLQICKYPSLLSYEFSPADEVKIIDDVFFVEAFV